ncbi:MAG: carboxypeptidase-like regulatory domain-containing protein [Pyrinomonadaceae bacterium]
MKERTVIVVAMLFLCCCIAAYSQHSKGCASTRQNVTTCWGWIKGHTAVDGGTVKEIRGRVVDPNEQPVPGALIEIYDNPDLDIDKRRRVAACRVGADGKFKFKGLRPGKYELRASYCDGSGFDAGHTIITFTPNYRGASKAETLVMLNLSQ